MNPDVPVYEGGVVKELDSKLDYSTGVPSEQRASSKAGGTHPEDHCHKCGGPNITWFAPSELWNKYAGDSDIICPICFVKMAEAAGFDKAWLLAPEVI